MKIDETWYVKPEGIPEHNAAGGVVIRRKGKNIYFATTFEIDTDALVLPKGHVEKDESFEECARREIEEEAGLRDLQLITYLGKKERLDFPKESWKKTHYFLFKTEQIDGVPTDPKHRKVVWLPLKEYTNHLWPEQRDLIKENLARIKSVG